jgi:hypothetical protein
MTIKHLHHQIRQGDVLLERVDRSPHGTPDEALPG